MEIIKTAVAGTLESSDIMVTLEPNTSGIAIELTSTVEKQFGALIKDVIMETLKEMDIENARIVAVDKGALDCTIKARVKTVICRATESDYVFKGES
ncbi:citrate lyase acyl carrier protein [Lachnospiraceae bacterium ZAX-1]